MLDLSNAPLTSLVLLQKSSSYARMYLMFLPWDFPQMYQDDVDTSVDNTCW